MSDFVRRIANTQYAIPVGAILLIVALASQADDNIHAELKRCSLIEGTSDRLACYDGLSSRQEAVPVAAIAPVEPPPDDQLADKPLDDVGPETAPPDADERYPTLLIRAAITKCGQDVNKKYYFYLENGQVWKQSDRKRVKFKDCDFEATITKDLFGYRMQQDGEERRIRITRVK